MQSQWNFRLKAVQCGCTLASNFSWAVCCKMRVARGKQNKCRLLRCNRRLALDVCLIASTLGIFLNENIKRDTAHTYVRVSHVLAGSAEERFASPVRVVLVCHVCIFCCIFCWCCSFFCLWLRRLDSNTKSTVANQAREQPIQPRRFQKWAPNISASGACSTQHKLKNTKRML